MCKHLHRSFQKKIRRTANVFHHVTKKNNTVVVRMPPLTTLCLAENCAEKSIKWSWVLVLHSVLSIKNAEQLNIAITISVYTFLPIVCWWKNRRNFQVWLDWSASKSRETNRKNRARWVRNSLHRAYECSQSFCSFSIFWCR